jgi:hypothetical protein
MNILCKKYGLHFALKKAVIRTYETLSTYRTTLRETQKTTNYIFTPVTTSALK